MKPVIDLIGRRFGRYTVTGEAVRRKTNRYWTCKCDCGAVREVPQSSLTTGQANSCGCLHREIIGAQAKRLFTKHGHTVNHQSSPEYRAWRNMNRRCHDPGFGEYTRYGQRGIEVWPAWRRSAEGAFERFLAYIGLRPCKGYSIERIDNNKNYEPGNVRWATPKEQANNRSTNTRITLDGRTQTLSQWCDELGVKPGTVMSRILRGWPVERALTETARTWTRREDPEPPAV